MALFGKKTQPHPKQQYNWQTPKGPKLVLFVKKIIGSTHWHTKKKWKLKTKKKFGWNCFQNVVSFQNHEDTSSPCSKISWNIKTRNIWRFSCSSDFPMPRRIRPLGPTASTTCAPWILTAVVVGSWWFASWNNSGSQHSHSCDLIFFAENFFGELFEI